MTRGTTLLELLLALALLGVLAGLAAPPLRVWTDRAAVEGAREAVVGLLVRTRAAAVAGDGAALVLELPGGRCRLEAGGESRAVLDLGRAFGVEVASGRSRGPVRVAYDGLGLGRVASRTLLFSRGRATATLVISSYGRVRRP